MIKSVHTTELSVPSTGSSQTQGLAGERERGMNIYGCNAHMKEETMSSDCGRRLCLLIVGGDYVC